MIVEAHQRGGTSFFRADQISRIVHCAPTVEHPEAGSLIFTLDGRYEQVNDKADDLTAQWRDALREWLAAHATEWAELR